MITPLLNMALGVLITLSVFGWRHTADGTLLVGLFLGPLVLLFSLMSVVDRGARYGATLAGLLLAVEGLFMHHILGSHSLTFDVAMGLLVAAISLVPNKEVAAEAATEKAG